MLYTLSSYARALVHLTHALLSLSLSSLVISLIRMRDATAHTCLGTLDYANRPKRNLFISARRALKGTARARAREERLGGRCEGSARAARGWRGT